MELVFLTCFVTENNIFTPKNPVKPNFFCIQLELVLFVIFCFQEFFFAVTFQSLAIKPSDKVLLIFQGIDFLTNTQLFIYSQYH